MLAQIVTLKQFCRFQANAAFTQSSPTVAGTIDAQWGYGDDHASTSATFTNLNKNGGGYVFEGDEDDYGIAVYSGSGTTWYIIQMECP